jgi:DNA-binding transcriptional MerR regulator
VIKYTLSDLARITEAKPRSLQFWAKEAVIQALPSTEGGGSGTHRRFSRNEAIIACIIAQFAARNVSLDGLKVVSDTLRSVGLRGFGDVFERAIRNERRYLVVGWGRSKGTQRWIQTRFHFVREEEEWEFSRLIETVCREDPKTEALAFVCVIPLHMALRPLASV